MTSLQRLASREDVSLNAKGLMLVITSFGRNGSCRPTRAQLIARSGLAANTLYRLMTELRTAGLLVTARIRDKKGRIRTMFMPFPPASTLSQSVGQGPCRKF